MILNAAFICLAVSIAFTVFRVLRGPTWGDRITALDFLGVNLAVLVVLTAIKTSFVAFLDVALIISVLGFLSTVAFTRYLLSGKVMK
ncbi:MAG: hypothetical protein JSV66_18560 [Trueperaceae bacterium]|nr:MAG: hypothetical protein JSV66_18560 [Trueperaceae bacterium]